MLPPPSVPKGKPSKKPAWRYAGGSACCLLNLFLDLEDGGDLSLSNLGWLSAEYTALYPRKRNLHNHRRENFKS
jgi:hypothetical protein